MKFRISLKTLFISIFVLFILILIFKLTPISHWLNVAFGKFGGYIALLTVMLVSGGLIYYLITHQREDNKDLTLKVWHYVKAWLQEGMGLDIDLKFEDVWIKEGYYGDKDHNERFYGISAIRKGTGQRVIFIVGTKPIRISSVFTIPKLARDSIDPFDVFYNQPPTPVGGMETKESFKPNWYDKKDYSRPTPPLKNNRPDQRDETKPNV